MENTLSKREQNRLARRDTIIEIATRSFLDQGYSATSMSEIAGKLGGSKATLWSYFTSKEELFCAVIDKMVDNHAREIDEILFSHPYSEDILRHFCLRFLELMNHPDKECLYRVIMGEGGRFPELGMMFYERGPKRMIDRLEKFLEPAFGKERACHLAKLLLSAIIGLRTNYVMRSQDMSEAERHEFIDMLFDMINFK